MMTADELDDRLDGATAQSMAALTILEKLLTFMHGRDPGGMTLFLAEALATAVPPAEHPDGETRTERLQRTSVQIQQKLLGSALGAQRSTSRAQH